MASIDPHDDISPPKVAKRLFTENDLNHCKKSEKEWICPVSACSQVLSRKQTLKTHLSNIHHFEHERAVKQYKLYEYDQSVPVPSITLYRHKRESVCSKEDAAQAEKSLHETAASLSMPCSSVSDTNICNVEDEDNSDHHGSDMDLSSFSSDFNDKSNDFDSDSSDSNAIDKNIENTPPVFTEEKTHDAPLYVIDQTSGIYTSEITQHEHLMAVMAFVSRFNLSDTCLKQLVELIGLHLPSNNLLLKDIHKMKERCGFSKDLMQFFVFCNVCKNVFGEGSERCETPNCSGQRNLVNSHSYFMTGNLELQLKEVLARHGVWQSIQDTHKNHQALNLTDIIDGKEYKKLRENGEFLCNENNISLTMFTDGVSLFKSSAVSLWPVYLLINEIPQGERFLKKNMILWGIWQGSGKPNMTLFLKSLVQDLNNIYYDGILLKIENEDITCRALLIVTTMDLPARSSVLHMTSHNGKNPCIYCSIPGETVKSGKGHCKTFPYTDDLHPLRTAAEIMHDSKEAQRTQKQVNGFTGNSVLNFLPHFSLNNNVVIDYMHGALLGITKKMLTLWLDVRYSGEPYYIGDSIRQLDRMLKSITPPYLITRLPRKLSNTMKHWKASELRSWLLFYSLPCLQGILPQLYLKHFSTFVEAVYILLGEGISENDLERATLLFNVFLKSIKELYKPNVLGINFHNLIHLTDCVRKWGPMWAWSCFSFESFNGDIKKYVHGTGNVCKQIFWSLQIQKKIENIPQQSDQNSVTEFINSMMEGKSNSDSGKPAHQCVIKKTQDLPANFIFPEHVKEQLAEITDHPNPSAFMRASKIIRNGYIMYSKSCTKVKKRNSYTVTITDGPGQRNCFFEIDYFLVQRNNLHVFAVGRRLRLVDGILTSNAPHVQVAEYCRYLRENPLVCSCQLNKELQALKLVEIDGSCTVMHTDVKYMLADIIEGTKQLNIDDINECTSRPCKNGATCKDIDQNTCDTYTCICLAGWSGRSCTVNIDDCLTKPCLNGGTCTDYVNTYNCTCVEGFTGEHCEIKIFVKLSNVENNDKQKKSVKTELLGIYSELSDKATDRSAIEPALQRLQNITSPVHASLSEADLGMVVGILDVIINATETSNDTIPSTIAEGFLQTASNSIDGYHNISGSEKEAYHREDNGDGNGVCTEGAILRRGFLEQGDDNVPNLLKSVERFGELYSVGMIENDEVKSIVSPNIVLQAKKSKPKTTVFPERNNSEIPSFMFESSGSVTIEKTTLENIYDDEQDVFFSAIFYKDIQTILPNAKDKRDDLGNSSVNSQVLAITVSPPAPEKLNPPISITLPHTYKNFSNPECVFWDFDSNFTGGWSTRGCHLAESSDDETRCLCNHMTNFAVLMSPGRAENTKALSVFSLVGCCVSIFGLVLTMFAYFFLRKYLKNKDRVVLLMNLCLALLIAYVVFLAGVTQTENKDGCTAVAVLLHYFYLAAFFFMLAEGMDIVVGTVCVLVKKSGAWKLWKLLLLGWGAPVVIVGVAMAASRMNGYGSEDYCWLSIENNLLWAFVAPVLLIIMANAIFTVLILRALYSTKLVSKSSTRQKAITGIRGIWVLLPVLGLTWVFGVFSVNEDLVVFQYLFAIFNSIQGGLIFVFYCFTDKQVRDAFKSWRQNRRRKKGISYDINTSDPSNRKRRRRSAQETSV